MTIGFLSYENETLIGGILVSSFNNYINEWGIKNKHFFYDLSGVNPNSTSSKDSGIFRYKEK